MAIAGRSGAGKSYLLERLIRQDIQNRSGFAVFDIAGGALADSLMRYLAERGTADPAVYDRAKVLDLSTWAAGELLRPIPGVRGPVLARNLARALLPTGQSKPAATLLRVVLNSLHRCGRPFTDLALALRKTGVARNPRCSGVRGHGRERKVAAVEASLLALLRPLLRIVASGLAAEPPVRFDLEEAVQNRSWLIVRATSAAERKIAELVLVRLAFEARSRASQRSEPLFSVYVDGADRLRSGVPWLAGICRRSRVGFVSAHRSSDGAWVQGPGVKLLMRMPRRHACGLLAAGTGRLARVLETFNRGEMLVYARRKAAEIVMVPSHAFARPSLAELERLDAAIRDGKGRQVHASSVSEAP